MAWLFCLIPVFRMPVFFLLSGYLAALLWQRRG
jgi:fucose 4-O-acetylase-like acetyltransferase